MTVSNSPKATSTAVRHHAVIDYQILLRSYRIPVSSDNELILRSCMLKMRLNSPVVDVDMRLIHVSRFYFHDDHHKTIPYILLNWEPKRESCLYIEVPLATHLETLQVPFSSRRSVEEVDELHVP
jgi:hypothetical protein